MNASRARRFGAALVSALVLAACAALHAQDRLDPVAMGKARASVATARGLGAVAANPGGLDLAGTCGHGDPADNPFGLSVYNVGGAVGSTYLSSSDFKQIFGAGVGWPDQNARARLGELLQDERLYAGVANNLVTAYHHLGAGGTVALHYGHRGWARLNFPEDFTRVIANGELLLEQYRFINRGVGGTWYTELGLSYAKSIGSGVNPGWFPQVGVGATVNMLNGVAQFDLDDNSYIAVDQKTLNGSRGYVIRGGYIVRSAQPEGLDPADAVSMFASALFPATSGSGWGFDLGIAGVLYRRPQQASGVRGAGDEAAAGGRNAVYFGVMLQNVGSIRWTDVAYERTQVGITDTLYNGTLNNDQFESYQGTLRRTDGYTTNLPAVVRAGLAVDLGAYGIMTGSADAPTTLLVEIEGELPINDVPGNAADPRLSVGADLAFHSGWAVRAGLTGGGVPGFGIGLGVGCPITDWLRLDIGTSEIDGLFAGDRLDAALRLAAHF